MTDKLQPHGGGFGEGNKSAAALVLFKREMSIQIICKFCDRNSKAWKIERITTNS